MEGSPEISGNLRRTLSRVVLFPSWLVVGILILLFASGMEVAEPVLYVPFALSLVLFGLPHGALDHLVPARLSGRAFSLRSVIGVALLYAGLAGIYLGLWTLAPVAAFGLFIVLTWLHWGQGDLYSLMAFFRTRYLAPPALRVLTIVVRGGLPMLVPLLVFPEVYLSVARSLVAVFGGSAALAWLVAPAFRTALGGAFFALVLVVAVWGYRRSGPRERGAWRTDVLETVLLAMYFAVVPPVLALGIYFCFWHATRHIARLMLLDETSTVALEKGDFWRALVAFTRDAAPLTGAALALLAGLYLLVPGRVVGPDGLLAVYLVLISVLTLPHVVIVGLMDRRQGVWR